MFARSRFLSFTTSLLFGVAVGLDLDVNSPDSIKSTAKTLASAIVNTYNDYLKDAGVPGLFSESGDPYYFWEAGAVWGGLLEYSYLTGDSQFNDLISSAVQHQVGDYEAFMPPNQTKVLGNDDQSMWGLTAMTAAEIGFPDPKTGAAWVDKAVNVWNTQAQRWDNESCGGGLRWQIFTFNNGYNYKNSISAGGFFLLSARLAQFTGNKTYSEWAEKTLQWGQDVGLISDDYHIFDGTDSEMNCSSVNHIQWSYNQGIFTEGSAIMYNISNGDDKWKEAVTGFVNASSVFQDEDSSVLYEVACETNGKCDIDQRAMKGVAARSFARAAKAAPFASDSLQKMIQASASAAAKNCDGDEKEVECASKWTGDDADKVSVNDEGLGEAFSAMEVVQALLWSQAKAVSGGSSGNSSNPSASGTGSPTATGSAQPTAGTGAAGTVVASRSIALMAAVLAMVYL